MAVFKRLRLAVIVIMMLYGVSGCNVQSGTYEKISVSDSISPASSNTASESGFMQKQIEAAEEYFEENKRNPLPFQPLNEDVYKEWDTEVPLTLIQTVEAYYYENRMDEFYALEIFKGDTREEIEALCPEFWKLTGIDPSKDIPLYGPEAVHITDVDWDDDREILLFQSGYLVILDRSPSGNWKGEELDYQEDLFKGICTYQNSVYVLNEYNRVELMRLEYDGGKETSASDSQDGPYSLDAVSMGFLMEDRESQVIFKDKEYEGVQALDGYINKHMADILAYGTENEHSYRSYLFQGTEKLVTRQFPYNTVWSTDYDNDGMPELVIEESWAQADARAEGRDGSYDNGVESGIVSADAPIPTFPLNQAFYIPYNIETPLFLQERLPGDICARRVWFQDIGGQIYMMRLYEIRYDRSYATNNILFIAGKIEGDTFRYLNITAFTSRMGLQAWQGDMGAYEETYADQQGKDFGLLNIIPSQTALEGVLGPEEEANQGRKAASCKLIPAYAAPDCTEEERNLLDAYVEYIYEDLVENGGWEARPVRGYRYESGSKRRFKGYTEKLTEDEKIKCRFMGFEPEDVVKADFNHDGLPEFLNLSLYNGSIYHWLDEDIWNVSDNRTIMLSRHMKFISDNVLPDRVNLWFCRHGKTIYTCILTEEEPGLYGLTILRFDGYMGRVLRSYGIRAKTPSS